MNFKDWKAFERGGFTAFTNILADWKAEREKLIEALDKLTDAAEAYEAEQETAPNPRCGNVQPISVTEGLDLHHALQQSRAVLEEAKGKE